MTDNKYNGWTNWETWNFNLWITDGLDVSNFEGIEDLRDYLESLYDELSPDLDNGFFGDLIDVAKREINFLEIAENLLESED